MNLTIFRHLEARLSILKVNKSNVTKKYFSTNPEIFIPNDIKAPITLTSPKEQNSDHIGLWYTINPETYHNLFYYNGLTKRYMELIEEAFYEKCVMIREPAISVIDLIKKSNLKVSPNKFVLYGRDGVGKTLSLAHVMHFLSEDQFIIVHLGIPAKWLTTYKEIIPSSQEGFYDHTQDASLWLQHFKSQNQLLLQNNSLVTCKMYEWTQREKTEEGSTILSLIEYGISRPRYASQCIYVLVQELKRLANEEKLKLAFVVDGVNSLYSTASKLLDESKKGVPAEKMTIICAFRQLFQNDWHNGVIVTSVDKLMSSKERRKSFLPRYLLGKEGWADFDPCIPIKVSDYTDLEFESLVDFCYAKKWLNYPIESSSEAKQELAFLSGKNPWELIKLINFR